MRRRLDLALVLGFALALAAPTVDSLASDDAVQSVWREERAPARFPRAPLSARELQEYPRAFERWFGDRLGFRDRLLRARAILLAFGLGVSPTPRMELGRDRWLFYTDLDAIPIARGLVPFTSAELKAWKRSLSSRARWCERHGLAFVAVFAPDKPDIYPDYLPARFEIVGPSRIDQLTRHLGPDPGFALIDLRPALRAERERDFELSAVGDFAYPPHGVHWSDRAMYGAYRALADHLAGLFPSIRPLERAAVRYAPEPWLGETWDRRLYLEGWLLQEERAFRGADAPPWRIVGGTGEYGTDLTTACDAPGLPRAVVVHDSFGEPLRRLLAHHFSRAAFLWGPDFELARILSEEPDVVIQVYSVRTLASGAPTPVASDLASESRQAFEASSAIRFALDPATQPVALAARGQTRLQPTPAGLEIRISTARDGLEIPPIEASPSTFPAVRIEIECERATSASLHYQTHAERTFSRKRAQLVALDAGRNDVVVELLDPALRGPLLLRLGDGPGVFVLRALEVRALPR